MSKEIELVDGIRARLISERKRLGYSIKRISELGGVQPTTQYSYESGKGRPSDLYFHNLDKAGINIYYVITGKLDRNVNESTNKLLVAFNNADSNIQIAILKILDLI